MSLLDVRKEINFCRKTEIPILGVVENMAGFVCPHCKCESVIFAPTSGGAEVMCQEMECQLIGRIPLDPSLLMACEGGKGYVEIAPDSPASKSIVSITTKIREMLEK